MNNMRNDPKHINLILILACLVVAVSIDRAVGAWDGDALPGVHYVSAAVQSEELEDSSITAELPTTKIFETVQGVLLDVCESRGYGEDCARTLLGMLWKESLNDAKAIGDSGRARGYFQIHYRLHGIPVGCAEDLHCSSNWTLSYLEQNGYPRYVTYAVQCHNGCNINNGYAASALRWGDRKWSSPLFLEHPETAVVLR
ncbi:hypothetical protein A2480_04100 [Candidatus Uhrbacteria bacterium RIFOXYC2_FULL_47_19]|uniref:Transglycosylase SLT domain-containing protein n=1 Tax=Candidatus Uhrbacteria bacterium RIFOXYC2_FULL_47_19 TaxID=1802424 RepID=A0A1F7WC62_9BACT|nr:MAG: hypothetical protein A2480_04100 [Candidatus Uhrbacteria bacterium RIFOXYC2_FULL_47_19]